jgi:hypothetical protein
MNNKIYTIYAIYTDNILLYIGSTNNFKSRSITHMSNIKHNNTNSNIKLYKYIKENNLQVEIYPLTTHENILKDDVQIIESLFINRYKPLLNVRCSIKPNRTNNKLYQYNKYIEYKFIKSEIKDMLNIVY